MAQAEAPSVCGDEKIDSVNPKLDRDVAPSTPDRPMVGDRNVLESWGCGERMTHPFFCRCREKKVAREPESKN